MTSAARPLKPRAQRRAETEARILDTARALFSDLGYDRTTIRAIASRAEVDPALIMQYFGSKDALFEKASCLPTQDAFTSGPDRLLDELLEVLGTKMTDYSMDSVATLRSMLTHPQAAEQVRDRLDAYVARISTQIDADDAPLRAALIIAIHRAVIIDRHLLRYAPIRDASPEHIVRLLQPCLRALIHPGKKKRKKKGKKS
ncbi:TetR family transcriptional regulator [Pendulispora albinea]|uniref:TetR family transcriptional regulator n=1 Tax=Pendulispora albinea TaxID=2741071 RepID=A0ABZ2LTB9_9BACT